MPQRIQRKRTKGWKMPADAIYVGRPTKWGNPFTIAAFGRAGALNQFRWRLQGRMAIGAVDLSELRGKDLACWCPLDKPCHADVLLEMANEEGNRP